MENTVCITGGNGFIGSHIILKLLQKNYIIHAIIRNANKDSHKIQHLINMPNAKTNLKIYDGDIMIKNSLIEPIKGCQYVFHIANPVLDPAIQTYENSVIPAINATKNILDVVQKNHPQVKRIIITSSIAAYGLFDKDLSYNEAINTKGIKEVKQEDNKLILTIDEDYNPNNEKYLENIKHWYSIGKTRANNEVNEFIKKNNPRFQVVTICPALVYGELLNPDAAYSMKNLMDIIEGTDHQFKFNMLPFIDVKDVADAHILGMNVLDPGKYLVSGEIITTDKIFSILDRILQKYNINRKIELKEDDDITTLLGNNIKIYDSSKLQKYGLKLRSLNDTLEDVVKSMKHFQLI